ncbi:MAG TPA: efflux RND transporter periplasmic adaptor subunit [Chthoniobacterales bacterium]
MTIKLFHKTIILIAALLAVWGFSACPKTTATHKTDPDVDYYTCTMHPSVKSQDPHGKCPICSMDLVPVIKKTNETGEMKGGMGETEHGSSSPTHPVAHSPILSAFTVPVERQQQIGVTYAQAKWQPLHHTIRSVGLIVPDKSRRWEFVARVEGYVQNLGVTSPGEPVEKDQPLLTIYSPELLTASRELVNLLDTRDRAASPDMRASTQRLIDSAKFRLAQWNVTERQIAELEKTRRPSEFLTLYSPFKGVVEDVPVDQGRKVMTGERLVNVADLTVVWVWAEFYENELPILKGGLPVTVTSASYPGRTFEGKIGLVNPFVNEMTRTGKVRIDIPNTDLALRPGMYVNIDLGMDMGEGLTIPVSAVMPTGKQSLVFVDQGEGKLEPRFVQLAGKYGDSYLVTDGLKDGERVVSSANFLIDAESKVQGAVKAFQAPEQADEGNAERANGGMGERANEEARP